MPILESFRRFSCANTIANGSTWKLLLSCFRYHMVNSVSLPSAAPCDTQCVRGHYCAATRLDYEDLRECRLATASPQPALRASPSTSGCPRAADPRSVLVAATLGALAFVARIILRASWCGSASVWATHSRSSASNLVTVEWQRVRHAGCDERDATSYALHANIQHSRLKNGAKRSFIVAVSAEYHCCTDCLDECHCGQMVQGRDFDELDGF